MTGEKDAPAEMPGEEEIARLICREVNPVQFDDLPEAASYLERKTHFDRPILDKTEGRDIARAILELFAPILAEKEREIDQAKAAALLQGANIDFMNAALDTAKDFVRRAKAAEARALAAEAALAAERERCIAIVDAQVPDWVKERSGPYWDGYREAMEDAAEDMRKGVPARAAAIRAEGE